MVIFVRQGLFCRSIKTTFQQQYSVVLILRQGGFNALNGQHMLGNADLQINLLCDGVFDGLKYILVCLNQNLHAGKINRH